MTVLFDIVHPAHVHFYRHVLRALTAEGIPTTVVARDKDVTHQLLRGYGIPFTSVGRSGEKGRLRQLGELAARDAILVKTILSTGTRLVLTRSPGGVQAARLTGRLGVFDTDDGRAAGIHFRAAAPFAHVITTPTSIVEDYGAKHRRYAGYKALAYLHPNHFTPDPSVFDALGLASGSEYSIVRFVHMVASHDRDEAGLATSAKRLLVEDLSSHGRVFVSSESPLPDDLRDLALDLPPHLMHDALAFARCYVGDSQTMAAEAALVGTPSFQISTWSRRLSYLAELEDDYGLVRSFLPTAVSEARAAIEDCFADEGDADRRREGWERLFEEKIDVAEWYLDLVHELLARRR